MDAKPQNEDKDKKVRRRYGVKDAKEEKERKKR
jgi:hypothetical protein